MARTRLKIDVNLGSAVAGFSRRHIFTVLGLIVRYRADKHVRRFHPEPDQFLDNGISPGRRHTIIHDFVLHGIQVLGAGTRVPDNPYRTTDIFVLGGNLFEDTFVPRPQFCGSIPKKDGRNLVGSSGRCRVEVR